MNTTIKRMAILAAVPTVALLGTTVPAHATSGSGHVSIKSESYDKSSQTLSWHNEQVIELSGRTQLLWWVPNGNWHVTKKQVRKAPHITAHYAKGCTNQSKQIAKQTNGAAIVVLKVGSHVCNTGKTGHIVGGFNWHIAKAPAVLKWNKKLGLYQHVYTLMNGKLKKACGNHIGGHIDKMFTNPVQVRYKHNLKKQGDLEADSAAMATLGLEVDCDNGSKFKVTAAAMAYGSASSSFMFTDKTRASVESANSVSLKDKSWGNMKASAESGAMASIDVEYTCSTGTVKQITITSMTDLNLIAAGKDSGEYDLTVNASDAGGSLTVDPGIGGVSTCDSTTPQGSLKFSNLSAGDSSFCVIIYAPNDADKPTSMTVTATAILGSAKDVKTDDVVIQYPTRP